MTYGSGEEPKQRLVARLYEAVQEDLAALPQGRAALRLSGGYDSRALPGLLHSSGRDFFCVSYSFGENPSPHSEAAVARHAASELGVPYRFYRAELSDPSRLFGDIQKAVAATGGRAMSLSHRTPF